MIDFLLIYEHKVRELDNLCLLRAVLEMRGYRVDIVNRFDYDMNQFYTGRRRPRVVGVVAAYDDHTLFSQMARYVGLGVRKVINFRWEQVFAESEIERGANSFHMPKQDARNVVHVCWGREPQRQLLENGNRRAVITGPIQMDFLSPQLRALYMDKDTLRASYGLPSGRMALYISTFAYGSLPDDELKKIEALTHNALTPIAQDQRKAQALTLDALEKLLERYPDLTVVYRPHQVEMSSKAVADVAARQPRFRVIGELSVKQWILAADNVITWVSTSVAEAYFAGVRVTLFRPCETPELSDPVIYKGCRACGTVEELIDEFENPKDDFPVSVERIEAYYDVDPDKLSCQRLADLFEAVYKTDQYDFDGARVRRVTLIKTRLAGALRRHLSHSARRDALCARVWPFTTQKKAMAEYERFKDQIATRDEIVRKVTMYKHALEQAR